MLFKDNLSRVKALTIWIYYQKNVKMWVAPEGQQESVDQLVPFDEEGRKQ